MTTTTTGVTAGQPPKDTQLAAHDITMRFRGLTALDDVSIDVPSASIVGLIGPNGAGKSTMLGVLSGLLRPSAGSVHLAGTTVTGSSPQRRARRGLARTFQHPEMFTGLSIREHLALAYRARHHRSRIWTDLVTGGGFRRPHPQEAAQVDELLQTLGLTALADAPVAGQPLGVTRLVELGRALATSPSVLLLDEPSSGLDGHETEQMTESLRRVVAEQGTSLLLVEHDVDLVLGLCSYVYVLDFGKLIASGTTDVIRKDPAVRIAYFGQDPGSGEQEDGS